MKKILGIAIVLISLFGNINIAGASVPDIVVFGLRFDPYEGQSDRVSVFVNNTGRTSSNYRILVDAGEVANSLTYCTEVNNRCSPRVTDANGIFTTTVFLEPEEGVEISLRLDRKDCAGLFTYLRAHYDRGVDGRWDGNHQQRGC